MGLLGLIAIGFLICWHNRRQKQLRRCEMAAQEQKSNNENEENLRRYRNPLFETDKGGGTGKRPSAEMIDLEKYEKSPARRIILHNENDNNDYNDSKQNTPMKMTKKKDCNIEISRTLMDRERDLVV
jgi:hypothetical protein